MATYYVDPVSGNDGNAGTSLGTAWKTTQKALDTAVAGDSVRLCATGVETITATIDADTNAGTSINPIRFFAANASGTIDGTKYTIRAGAAITAVINFAAAADATRWQGVDFDGNSQATYAIYNNVDGSDGHNFTACRSRRATSHGIYIRGSAWRFDGHESDNNGGQGIGHSAANRANIYFFRGSLHHNASTGWLVDANGCRLTGSRVYRNGGSGGVELGSNSNGFMCEGNTFYGNTNDGLRFFNATSRSDNAVIGNTFTANTAYGIRFNTADSDTASVCDYNHTHGNGTAASDLTLPGNFNKTGDPLFTSTTNGSEDFRPSSSSPLVGANVDGSAIGALAPAAGGSGTVDIFRGSLIR